MDAALSLRPSIAEAARKRRIQEDDDFETSDIAEGPRSEVRVA